MKKQVLEKFQQAHIKNLAFLRGKKVQIQAEASQPKFANIWATCGQDCHGMVNNTNNNNNYYYY